MKLKTKNKKLEHYLNLTYPIQLLKIPDDEGGGWEVSIPLLGRYAFRADGETPQEALKNLEEIKRTLFEEHISDGVKIPEPVKDEKKDNYSGKFIVRIPKELHEKISYQAKRNSISLNQYILYLLTQNFYSNKQNTP